MFTLGVERVTFEYFSPINKENLCLPSGLKGLQSNIFHK